MRVGLEVIPSIVLDALSFFFFFFLACLLLGFFSIALATEPILFFLTLYMLGNFSCFCCRLLTFFTISFFTKKNLSGTLSENQTNWIRIRI